MTEDLTKDQQMLLWELFAAGGEQLQGGLFKKAGPKVIGPLVESRHVGISKRGKANLITLQDGGWRWVADSEPFPVLPDEKRVSAERRLLASLVGSVKRYAGAQGLQIQDLFRSVEPRREDPPSERAKPVRSSRRKTPDPDDVEGGKVETTTPPRRRGAKKETPTGTGVLGVEERIRSAFFDIAGRPARDNVRLSALRAALTDVPRKDVDRALLAMRKGGTANLMNLDNPRDIAAEAEAALTSGHSTFHVIRIDE